MYIIVYVKNDKYMIYTILYNCARSAKLRYVCSTFAETFKCVKTIYHKDQGLRAFINEVLEK